MPKPTIRWGRLGWRLREAMQNSGASFRDFEKITGLDHNALHRIANGKPCKAEAFMAVCEVLEIDPMTLYVADAPEDIHQRN